MKTRRWLAGWRPELHAQGRVPGRLRGARLAGWRLRSRRARTWGAINAKGLARLGDAPPPLPPAFPPARRSGRPGLGAMASRFSSAPSLGDPLASKAAGTASARQSGVWGARPSLGGDGGQASARASARGGSRWK